MADGSSYDFVAAQTTVHLRNVYTIKFAPLAMQMTGIMPRPEDFENYIPGAKEILLQAVENHGEAEEVNAQGVIYFNVGTTGMREVVPVRTYAARCNYTLDEVRQAMLMDRDLPMEQVRAGIELLMRRHDRYAFSGDADAKDSFARSTNITQSDLAAADGLITQDDVNEIYEVLSALVTAPSNQTGGMYPATHLALPLNVYNKIQGAIRPDTTQTVRNALIDAYDITIVPIFKLKDAGDAGTTGRAVAYSNHMDVGRNLLLMPEMIHEPLRTDLAWCAIAECKTGGFYWQNSLGAHYLDNVGA